MMPAIEASPQQHVCRPLHLQVVEAGDRAKGSWVGTYITHHTDMTTVNPIAGVLSLSLA
jgi:hypothetical protein